MENAELDVALEELESRLERLRALYEQYFMGIERIEPSIPRKDVDRRIYVLRREKIRNTAKRFKLQTIISRYNTFQQYWQRICREIEAGTYKRHLIRAERIAPGKMLTIAARKRLGRAALEAAGVDSVPPEAAPPSAPPSELPAAAAASGPGAAAAAPGAPAAPRLAPPPKPVPPPKPGARPAPPAPIAQPRVAFESLDLDMDFLGDWDPSTSVKSPGVKRAPDVPARPFGKPLSRPLSAAPAAPLITEGLKAPPPAAPKLGASPALPLPPRAPAPALPKPAAAPVRPVLPRPALAADSAPGASPAPPARPLPVRPAPPPPDAKSLGALVPGPSPVRPPAPSAPKPPAPAAAIPAKPAAPLAAKPAPAVAAAAVAKPAAAPPPVVHDDRVRELHARLVEAKRQTQDGAAVSMEGLAKSMKATEAKLREQHKNRKIDFDVVIKDGKAVLKPIVR